MEAYGTLGLTPQQFADLTVPEFESMIDGSRLRDARMMKLLAQSIAQLLTPYMREQDRGTLPWVVEGMLGGDPEKKVLEERTKRLATLLEGI